MGRVESKIALITGAARGLGQATAELLAREGAIVVVTDIDGDGADATAEGIAAAGGTAMALTQDVTDERRWTEVVAAIDETYGALDILVNNAGIAAVGTVLDETAESWRRTHAIDLDSVFFGCRAAIPLLAASGGGSIVNISSISGVIAGHNLAAYNSAKAAVTHLSKSVALHCANDGNGIRCNSVHPVFVDTPMLDSMSLTADRARLLEKLGRQIPLGRVARPEDVAYAVLYLASDESAFVTGTELRVDGGISAR